MDFIVGGYALAVNLLCIWLIHERHSLERKLDDRGFDLDLAESEARSAARDRAKLITERDEARAAIERLRPVRGARGRFATRS